MHHRFPLAAYRVSLPAVVAVLLAQAACGGDGGGGSSDVGTLAYIVTSCHEEAGAATLQQELRIFHGAGETVTAMSVGPLGPFTSYGLCALSGRNRTSLATSLGAFQRLGVTPDGTGVVFDLTDAHALVGRDLLPQAQRGMYYVRADGSGLRPLGPPSQAPTFYFVTPPGLSLFDTRFNFDPSGRQFTYTDLGFDDAGEEGPQVFMQGLTSGERRQLTRLPRIAQGEPPALGWPVFIDARTILFGRFTEPPDRITALTVDTVDMHLRDAPTVALPGGAVVPTFHIIGGQWLAVPIRVGAEAVNPVPGQSVKEVFVTDGSNVLQLTDFRRTDTSLFEPFFSPRDERVYFTASADPLGTNPLRDCQIFSMEPVGRDLRQVTSLHEGGDHWNACSGGRLPNGCRIDFPYLSAQQPLTGTIYFRSTCDPFGLNPNGTQLFSIQPDGTDLRQLTNARGFVQGADRTVDVETVDQVFKYSPHR